MEDIHVDTSTVLTTLFLLSVVLILVLDYHIKARHSKMMTELQLNKLFWKFLSSHQIQQYKTYLRYNLLKLFLASIIISTLTYFITNKKYPPLFCSQFSLAVFFIWNVGSILFYYILNHSKNFKSLQYSSLYTENYDSITPTTTITHNDAVLKKMKENKADFMENDNTTTTTTTTNQSTVKKRLPVTVITGFLGAGKTTLVKNILNNTIGLKVLVIENEIGAEGVDHDLLLTSIKKEEIVLLNNGCICCTVRNDLIETFHTLLTSTAFLQLDWVVIETTGIADPAPIIQLFYMDPQCKEKLCIDSVITVIDSKHIFNHLLATNTPLTDDPKTTTTTSYEIVDETISHQIGYADIIILNKIDLVSALELSSITTTITILNTTATIYPCSLTTSNSSSSSSPHDHIPNISIEQLLNIKAYDNPNNNNNNWKTKNKNNLGRKTTTTSNSNNMIFPILRNEKGEIAKRKVRSGTTTPSLVTTASRSQRSRTRTVTTPHSGISTLTVVSRVPLDLDAFNRWISLLLKLHGEKIFRMKGILFMSGYDRQFVVQGIHMIFEGTIGSKWSDIIDDTATVDAATTTDTMKKLSSTLPYSKLVFIGKSLHEMNLESNFHACEVEVEIIDDDEVPQSSF